MILQSLAQIAIQSSILFLIIWIVFRCVPSFPPNSKAWIWRLAFLKPIAGLLPFAAVTLHILAPPPPVQITNGSPIATTGSAHETYPHSNSTSVISSTSNPIEYRIDPILILWIAGSSSVAAWALISRLKAAQIVRKATSVQSHQFNSVLNNLLSKANLQTKITLQQSSEVQSAMLFGGRRNIIVLPLNCEDNDEIRMMLAHEVAHIARRDLAWQTLTWIVRCLFFFNPIVWLAVQSSQLDHESATDRYACELAGVPVQTYAEMLLRVTVVTRSPLVPGALSVGESYRTIHRRLEAMNHFNSKPNPIRKTAVGLVALATVGLIPMYQFAQAQPPQKQDVKPKVAQAKKSKQIQKDARPAGIAIAPAQGEQRRIVDLSPGAQSQAEPQEFRRVVDLAQNTVRSKTEAERIAIIPRGPYLVQPSIAQAPVRGSATIVSPASPVKSKGEPVQGRAIIVETVKPAQSPFQGNLVLAQPTKTAPKTKSSKPKSISVIPPKASSDPFLVAPNQLQLPATATEVTSGAVLRATRSGADPFSSQIEATSTEGGKLVSFNFEKADVRQALIRFFEATGRSYVMGDGVKGTINVSGQKVPFDLALAEILKAAKIESYAENGTIVLIGPKG